jgi:hypothetical protein|eukprot:COSAG03_NODE_30_length_18664_cov_5.381524_6_plen_262_part_00
MTKAAIAAVDDDYGKCFSKGSCASYIASLWLTVSCTACMCFTGAFACRSASCPPTTYSSLWACNSGFHRESSSAPRLPFWCSMKTVISLWNSFQLIGVFLCVLPVISSRSLINACASRCSVRARPAFMRRTVHEVRRTSLHAANKSQRPHHERRVSGTAVTNRRQSGLFVVSQPVVENVVVLRKQSCDLHRTRLVRESTSCRQQHNTAHLADINPDISVFVVIMPSPRLLPVAPVATEQARRGTRSTDVLCNYGTELWRRQ